MVVGSDVGGVGGCGGGGWGGRGGVGGARCGMGQEAEEAGDKKGGGKVA